MYRLGNLLDVYYFVYSSILGEVNMQLSSLVERKNMKLKKNFPSPSNTMGSGNHVIVIYERSAAMKFSIVHQSSHPRVPIHAGRHTTDNSNLLVNKSALCKEKIMRENDSKLIIIDSRLSNNLVNLPQVQFPSGSFSSTSTLGAPKISSKNILPVP